LIDWCFTPIVLVFELYRGVVNRFIKHIYLNKEWGTVVNVFIYLWCWRGVKFKTVPI